MTVQELMDMLQKLPPDMECFFDTYNELIPLNSSRYPGVGDLEIRQDEDTPYLVIADYEGWGTGGVNIREYVKGVE